MDNKHRVHSISRFLGNEGTEDEIAVKSCNEHDNYRVSHIQHIAIEVGMQTIENGYKKNVKE